MKSLTIALGCLLGSTAMAEMSFKPRPMPTPPPMVNAESVIFTDSNHVVLNDEVAGDSIAKVMIDLMSLKTQKPILFINSPGGSIDAGMRLVDAIVGSPREITCVSTFAASMAFVIFESCHKRYILNDSTLMQHQASFGAAGQEENFKAYSSYIFTMLNKINRAQADRMGVSLDEFNKRREHDMWLYGEDAISAKAADAVVAATCTEDLVLSKKTVSYFTIFGQIDLIYSRCPLMVDPIDIDFKGIYEDTKRAKIYDMFMRKSREPVPFFSSTKRVGGTTGNDAPTLRQ